MELSIKCSGCKKEYFIIVCREKENINNEKYILANKTLFNTNFGIVSNCPYCKSENVYIPNEIEKSWYILCNTRVISSTSKENTDRANEILYRIRNCANYLYKESDIKELLNE